MEMQVCLVRQHGFNGIGRVKGDETKPAGPPCFSVKQQHRLDHLNG